MASYPPPYPPPMDYKAQQRAMKAQARAQRDQMRMQARMMRRGSIVGPLLLVAVGVLFLLVELGKFHWLELLGWYGRWWPALLIGAGLILLAEWALDQKAWSQSAEDRVTDGLPLRGARTLGGGTVWLLVLLAILGGMSHLTSHGLMHLNDRGWYFNGDDFNRALGDAHDSDDSMSQVVPADGSVAFDNPRGDVTVSGTSGDGQMHIAIHKQVYAFNDNDANGKAQSLQPMVTNDGGHLTVRVPRIEGGHADLMVEVPRTVAVTVSADNGDTHVSGIHGAVVVNGNRGSVDLSGLTGDVTAHLHNSGASFTAHSITGPVTLDGRAGDVNVSDVHGAVALTGDFFGTTHLERINGSARFKTSRTDLQMARLDGEMELDTGSDLRADQVMGPVVLMTRQRNITLDRVQGDVKVGNRDGSVTVTSASPLGSVEITNKHGSVDVGVPATAGFVVKASTRHGGIENDFALQKTGSDESPEVSGTVGRGGSEVRIQTSDGDVTLRKSTVMPLSPLPPLQPLTAVPAAPLVPAPPTFPRAPKAAKPTSPRAPVAPKARQGEPAAPNAAVKPVRAPWTGTLIGNSLG